MTVRAILSQKGKHVVTIKPTATLSEAVKMLAEKRIGAVVVNGPEEHLIGILSERDIVAAVAERGAPALDQPVGEVITRRVVTCTKSQTVGEIMEAMTAGKFRHLPVVDRGRLAGIISIGDVVKFRLGEMEHESMALKEYILTA